MSVLREAAAAISYSIKEWNVIKQGGLSQDDVTFLVERIDILYQLYVTSLEIRAATIGEDISDVIGTTFLAS